MAQIFKLHEYDSLTLGGPIQCPFLLKKVIQTLSLNSDPCDWILSSRANECFELRHFFMPQERIKIFEKCITR